jgi:Phosphotransferase enzyme family
MELAHERPWSMVWRVPHADGVAWFKTCGAVQAFEPRLTGELFARWPERVPRVLGHDDERAWLLLADAGTTMRTLGNPPAVWLQVLPLYAELQRGEAPYALDHLAHGVPDQRLAAWPARYDDLLHSELPLDADELQQLADFAPRFAELCEALVAFDVPSTIQHDDLHMLNVYRDGDTLRLLDWGDSSISHPFVSLIVTYRFLDELNQLLPEDPWFTRLRDAYLEPWGPGLEDAFALALRSGAFAHAFGWRRQRQFLPDSALPGFDSGFRIILRRALTRTRD